MCVETLMMNKSGRERLSASGLQANLFKRCAVQVHPTEKPVKAYRVVERKLYPNAEQLATLERYRRECCRFYNRALEHRIKSYKRRKQSVSYYDQQGLLTKQRKRIFRLSTVPLGFVRDALRRIDRVFKAFFRRVKAGAKRKGFPRFKPSIRYRSMEYLMLGRYFRLGRVYVPGIGIVRSRGRYDSGKTKILRLIKRGHTWFAQTRFEVQPIDANQPEESVGIDMGLTAFATLSNGEKIENPRWYRKAERHLKHLSRELSRKQKGSANRAKARAKLAAAHELVAANRKDFCHQESRKLVNRFRLIGFEKLNIIGLARTRMAKSVHDASWGLFQNFTAYKAENAGGRVVLVDCRGTSQECPWCGNIVKKLLSERQHRCECRPGVVIDRDEAAAIVVEARAVVVATALYLRRDGPLALGAIPMLSPPNETGSPGVAKLS